MTRLSWCVTHDSGWQDDGCFAAEVAGHGGLADCLMVEMELHPVGTRVVSDESEHCDACGLAYDDVYVLPDDLWALIHERAPAGLLCPACALRRVVESSRVVTAEALVVEKVDGEWPAWAEGNAAEAISYDAPNTAGVEVLDWMLRMQTLAAKETP